MKSYVQYVQCTIAFVISIRNKEVTWIKEILPKIIWTTKPQNKKKFKMEFQKGKSNL